jgi:hypothetical protein
VRTADEYAEMAEERSVVPAAALFYAVLAVAAAIQEAGAEGSGR